MIVDKQVAEPQRRSSAVPLLTFLCVVLLGAFLWLLYRDYQNRKCVKTELKHTVVERIRNKEEQKLIDSINATAINEVFVLNLPEAAPVVVTDSIFVNKDSLHIIGNGVTIVSDTSYNGPAFTMGSSCKYFLLDSVTLENFDIGVLAKNPGLHLKNVQFKNCRIPVQYNFFFNKAVVNGSLADTIFHDADAVKTDF